ncbi:MAG TPA: MauE/DoxX family redox-associated membrane protein [Flavisolibacter sp.]|nr:MauE/DoxX family redox-associated membrane protein [Flavisolibacter sp.]
MKPPVTILLLSSLLLFLFTYMGISKLTDLEGFRESLMRVPFIGMGAGVLALATPLAELVIVLLLLFPATRLKGLYASAGMLLLFTLYLAGMLLFAPGLPCSCGGVISGMGWWEHVGMNVGMVGLTVMGIRGLKRQGGKEVTRQ